MGFFIKYFSFQNLNDIGKGVFFEHHGTQNHLFEFNGLRGNFTVL